MKNFKINEKIKNKRVSLGLTQSEVCANRITRNMLSLIEQGKATPSLETLSYLSEKLDLSLPFLLSNDEDAFLFEKNQKIERIRAFYSNGRYEECIKLIDMLGTNDDETIMIKAFCAFNHGKDLFYSGSLVSANKYLTLSLDLQDKTVYPTDEIKAAAPLYLALSNNVQSPLLEFDAETFEAIHSKAYDYELYKYITSDETFEYKNEYFKKHLEAKSFIKKYKFFDAIEILLSIEDDKNKVLNAPLLFGVYADLENVYKQIGDFEKAYRYSSKRLAMINAFKV